MLLQEACTPGAPGLALCCLLACWQVPGLLSHSRGAALAEDLVLALLQEPPPLRLSTDASSPAATVVASADQVLPCFWCRDAWSQAHAFLVACRQGMH